MGGKRYWKPEDDITLAQLFRSKTIDPKKIDSKSIKEAQKHFPHYPESAYASFASVYKGKASKWILGEALTGKRGPPSK